MRPAGDSKKSSDPVGPFSMTDEECDIDAFRRYLTTLGPEALWDILSHLDAERYPRRHEAARRETDRRHLFFVPPYTHFEIRLRTFLLISVFLAALAAVLRFVGGFALDVPTYERLPFFTDLAVGGPKAARLLAPIALWAADAAAIGMTVAAGVSLYLLSRRRLRLDIAGMVALAVGSIALCLHFAHR